MIHYSSMGLATGLGLGSSSPVSRAGEDLFRRLTGSCGDAGSPGTGTSRQLTPGEPALTTGSTPSGQLHAGRQDATLVCLTTAAPRPVDDTQPVELAARLVEGTGLSKQYPEGRLVISDVGDDRQSILLVE